MEIVDVLNKMENGKGFFKNNNYHIEKIDEEEIILRADLNEDSMNPYNMAHGGLIFGLGDTVMGMTVAKDGRRAITVNANISYLHPGEGKYLLAEAKIIKKGKTICVVSANIYNDQKKLISTMESTYYYID